MISIILPTYNGGARISKAIESVLKQTYTHWELLVLDDGSVDNTREVVQQFSQNDPRIRYIKNEQNLGIQKTLNKGIRESKGEYIARIDDDDTWIDTDKIGAQIAFLNEHRDCVFVGTGLVAVNEKGEEIFRHIPAQTDTAIRAVILNKTSFTHSSVVFQKDAALKFGGYSESEEVRHIEDYDLWLKLGTVGTLANLPRYSVELVVRDGGLSSTNKIAQFKKSLELIQKFKHQYPHYYKARCSLLFRMNAYKVLQSWPLRFLFAKLYKLYKNS